MWRDLNAAGMVCGHAYGKALRTVKTCVGSDWCRFGTQDSTGAGREAGEDDLGLAGRPHKVKLAVSGCPRNCAEATIKDFGVVCVDSGWELHVGGNGGIHVRGTDMLCKVATEEEVLEYCGAFLQLYREEARYLERTAPWMERVGLDYVKAQIVDDAEGRRALHERFLYLAAASRRRSLGGARRRRRRRRAFKPLVAGGVTRHGRHDHRPMAGPRSAAVTTSRASGAPRASPAPAATIAVFRTGDDTHLRAADRCPHKGGPLSQGIVHGHA